MVVYELAMSYRQVACRSNRSAVTCAPTGKRQSDQRDVCVIGNVEYPRFPVGINGNICPRCINRDTWERFPFIGACSCLFFWKLSQFPFTRERNLHEQ